MRNSSRNTSGTKSVMRVLLIALPLAVTLACSKNDLIAPTGTPDTAFWALKIDKPAVTLTPGQTEQLSATPYTAVGTTISGLPAPVYKSTDTSIVLVDQTGKLTARATGNNIPVVVTLQSPVDKITNSDTTYVTVTASSHMLATFTIHPTDSTTLAAGEAKTLDYRATELGGAPVTDLGVRYFSSDPGTLDVNAFTGALTAKKPGVVKIVAFTASYGTVKTDTVAITVTYPITSWLGVYNTINRGTVVIPFTFYFRDITLRQHATMYFFNDDTDPVDIIFDHPESVTGGNILDLTSDSSEAYGARQFNLVGTFKYKTGVGTDSGTVTVVP